MATGIDPTVDFVFKRLFGDEDNALLLVDLLNAVIPFPAGKLVSGVELLNPFVDKDYAEGKVSVLDVWARDNPGRQFMLEMQKRLAADFGKRLLYYWSCVHSGQMTEGQRYELLQPTYAICFLNEPLYPADATMHRVFQPCDPISGVLLCKDLEIHLLELSKFALTVDQVQTPLERWCYFLKNGASLDPASLSATLDVPVIRKAVEVLMKISQSEIDRHRYLERQRAERDAASREEYAQHAEEIGYKRGAEEGFEKGIEKGIEKGKRVGRIQLLQQLLEQPETPGEQLNQRDEKALAELEQSLKQQLAARKQTNGTPPADKT